MHGHAKKSYNTIMSTTNRVFFMVDADHAVLRRTAKFTTQYFSKVGVRVMVRVTVTVSEVGW
jgi:hypothetical protein